MARYNLIKNQKQKTPAYPPGPAEKMKPFIVFCISKLPILPDEQNEQKKIAFR